MRTTREMPRLGADLPAEARGGRPADVAGLIRALCTALGRRRGGRPVGFRFTAFPPDSAGGPWLEPEDVDLVVIEVRTRPEHQIVIACHERWHVAGGTGYELGPGLAVTARLTARHAGPAEPPAREDGPDAVVRQAAARAGQGDPSEIRAEAFGLHLGMLLRPSRPARREERFPGAPERINTSLGWGSPASRG
ncbi:toxin-antitoxin system, toxin component [Streptomyces sp. NPDC029003]|uniref:toxin-antitoxin system, toxin component n=1 Tax=Streptomyces sp. NPDC029003 TaxID=3155125 RepID=UPI0034041ADE